MQLHLDHLYQILTTEAFCAADRLKPMLRSTTQSQYDQIVQNIASELKSVVMFDGEIEEGARQTLVHNIIERMEVEAFMHHNVDKKFSLFVQQQIPEEFHEIIETLALDTRNLSARVKDDGQLNIQIEWFWGAWMPEYPLKEALEGLEKVHKFLEFSRDERDFTGDKRLALIHTKLKKEAAPRTHQRLFERFLQAFEHHPLRDDYIQCVGKRSSIPMLKYNSFNCNRCITSDTRNQIHLVSGELHRLWDAFAATRIDILSRQVGEHIRQRCNALIECMVNAPMTTSVEVAVAVDKSSVERYREKDVPVSTLSKESPKI